MFANNFEDGGIESTTGDLGAFSSQNLTFPRQVQPIYVPPPNAQKFTGYNADVMLQRFNNFLGENNLFHPQTSYLNSDSSDDEIESSSSDMDYEEWIEISKNLINTDDESDGEIVVVDPVRIPKIEETKLDLNCKLCNKNFISKKTLRVHLKKVHKKAEENVLDVKPARIFASSKKVACDICQKLLNKSNLSRHKRVLHPEFSEEEKKVVKIKKDPSEMFRCNFPNCQTEYTNRSSLRVHQKMHEDPNLTFECKMCPYRCRSEKVLKSHVTTKHTSAISVKVVRAASQVAPLHPANLPMTLQPVPLQLPVKRESPVPLSATPQSPTKAVLFDLQPPTRVLQNKNIERICTICNMKFNTLKELGSHRKIHDDRPRFACEICGVSYYKRYSIVLHYQKHHQDTALIPEEFLVNSSKNQCSICSRTFGSLPLLQRHEETHKENNKEFQCKFCPSLYSDAGSLTKHIIKIHPQSLQENLVQNNEVVFKCDSCEKIFTTEACLSSHKKLYHQKLPPTQSTSSSYQIVVQSSSPLTSSYSLKENLVEFHSVQPRKFYKCDQCPMQFVLQSDLKAHANRLHRPTLIDMKLS